MITETESDAGSASTPSVALVVVNHDGQEHLRACLDSIADLDYPRELLETIVVDNASTDGSRELIAERYPWVRVLAQSTNLGFAGGVNAGARGATSECVATCNNDMRLDSAWLRELVAAYEPANGFVCVSGLILDWEGRRIDFADGYMTAYGAAGQLGYGSPLEEVVVEDFRELPFACGGSFLIDRRVFLELDGFDEAFFALFEDVDLGWRLRLAGFRIRLAAKARSYHHHHGTVGRLGLHRRQFLYERNALRTLLKNVGDEHLPSMLSLALFLVAHRAVLDAGGSTADFRAGASDNDESIAVPKVALAGVHAAADVLDDLEAILDQRARVQRMRRRTDDEIFARFGRPFLPTHDDAPHLAASANLVCLLGLDEIFVRRRATTLLVVGSGTRGRTAELARAAAREARVVYASTDRRVAIDGVETLVVGGEELDGLSAESDVILVEASSPHVESLACAGRTLVIEPDVEAEPTLAHRADLVLPATDAEAALRRVLKGPPRLGATEDAQLLLARWRRAYGVGEPFTRRVSRAVWDTLPEPVRRRVRPILKRR